MVQRLLCQRERGQSLVEFSLASMIFFAMVFGLIDVSRAVWNYNTLAQATREGTRYAIVHGSLSDDPATSGDQQDIVDQVEQFAGGLNLSQLSVTATWPDGSNEPGERVTVESSYTYNPLFDLLDFVSIGMSSSSTMDIRH
jgi:Flp pilus assembly protein TadG